MKLRLSSVKKVLLVVMTGIVGILFYLNISSCEMDSVTYDSMVERAETALRYSKRKGLSERYCLFVDYSIPSGTPRVFVWDFNEGKVIGRTYCMHGPGLGSTQEKPAFSNVPGSKCSALGKFAVTHEHGQKLKRSFRLKGLEKLNRTAYARGLMIHRSRLVDRNCHKKYLPLDERSCMGCVTVSSRGMSYLEKIINSEKKELLLWSYCSED